MGDPTHQGEDTASALADELLAVRCQLGEPAALDNLVDRWHVPLWQYVRRMSDDDDTAAETLQEVWLRVLRAIPALRDPSRLRPWLFGIARRAVIDRLRAAYAEPLDGGVDINAVAAEAEYDFDESTDVVHESLAMLPVGPREVLVLFYLHELSLNQIADVLSVPVGTVKSRLFTARAQLRRVLIERGWEP